MASVLLSACGLLVGIEPLSVGDDGGGVVLQDAEASADAEGSTGDASTEAGPEPLRRPPEGTYVYAVTGSDKISGAFSFGTTYGPTATLTVGYVGADCFKQTFVLRDGYEETMNSCIEGVDSVEHTGARSQRFALGISAQTTSTCMPGDVYFTSAPSPGRSWNHDCSGKNTDDKSGQSTFSTVGSYRFIGNETISISGSAVPVMHFHDERNVSGAQTGTNVADWYLTVEDGVLVRLSRNINLDYGSVIGNINYRETVLMTLQTPPGLLLDAGAD